MIDLGTATKPENILEFNYLIYWLIDWLIDLGAATEPKYPQGEEIYELINYFIELLIDWLI